MGHVVFTKLINRPDIHLQLGLKPGTPPVANVPPVESGIRPIPEIGDDGNDEEAQEPGLSRQDRDEGDLPGKVAVLSLEGEAGEQEVQTMGEPDRIEFPMDTDIAEPDEIRPEDAIDEISADDEEFTMEEILVKLQGVRIIKISIHQMDAILSAPRTLDQPT